METAEEISSHIPITMTVITHSVFN